MMCLRNLSPFISCFLILLARLVLSALRVPSNIIASPTCLVTSNIKCVVGFIFYRSVHQRNILLGAGYPFPIKLTQKVSSNLGIVRWTYIGIACSTAASWILIKTRSVYSMILGFSTNVLLHTT